MHYKKCRVYGGVTRIKHIVLKQKIYPKHYLQLASSSEKTWSENLCSDEAKVFLFSLFFYLKANWRLRQETNTAHPSDQTVLATVAASWQDAFLFAGTTITLSVTLRIRVKHVIGETILLCGNRCRLANRYPVNIFFSDLSRELWGFRRFPAQTESSRENVPSLILLPSVCVSVIILSCWANAFSITFTRAAVSCSTVNVR